jgi:hypothetical protein
VRFDFAHEAALVKIDERCLASTIPRRHLHDVTPEVSANDW